MKFFEEVNFEVIAFAAEDVITDSPFDPRDPIEGIPEEL